MVVGLLLLLLLAPLLMLMLLPLLPSLPCPCLRGVCCKSRSTAAAAALAVHSPPAAASAAGMCLAVWVPHNAEGVSCLWALILVAVPAPLCRRQRRSEQAGFRDQTSLTTW